MVVGLTTFDPDEKVYVDAPLGVKVKLFPEQITPEFTLTVGVMFTVIVLTAVFIDTQPSELVPVTL